MAADFLRQVHPSIWHSIAGSSVHIPPLNSTVYYFPQGHLQHSSSPSHSLIPLPPIPCRLLHVILLADPHSDEVFAKLRLSPIYNSSTDGDFFSRAMPEADEEGEGVVSFAKVLTASDANNGGGFSVPKYCADSVFPPLDFAADPPVQTVEMTDVSGGGSWRFRHIYRGTPRRHLLTTGWSKFVSSKRLVTGDSVVFVKERGSGRRFVGIRRGLRLTEDWIWGRRERECVEEAVARAANGRVFEVVYYPRAGAGLGEFVVAAEKVDMAIGLGWREGMRVKMGVELGDSSRMSWIQGTVAAVTDCGLRQRSPWRMLQVAWDEPGVLENMKRVSPWQVELVLPAPHLDAAVFPAAKRLRLPPYRGFLTDGEANFPLPRMGFGDSMIGHLGSSYLNHNTFPAGMQGARQNTLSVPSFTNIMRDGTRQAFHVGNANNNFFQKAETVPTDLSIGSPQSDILSPDNSNSILSASPDCNGLMAGTSTPKVVISSFQLFGQTIDTACDVGSNKYGAGSGRDCADKGAKEKEGFKNLMGIRSSKPCMDLLDRIGAPNSTLAVEDLKLALYG